MASDETILGPNAGLRISFAESHSQIGYRGQPFNIEWTFYNGPPSDDALITLYAESKLIFATEGDSITSYEYIPTECGSMRFFIYIDSPNDDVWMDESHITVEIKNGTLENDIHYIWSLIADKLEEQNVLYSSNDGLTTLIEKIYHIEQDPTSIDLADVLLLLNNSSKQVGGANGSVTYALNTFSNENFIRRTCTGWSNADQCILYMNPDGGENNCFETIFNIYDGKERPSVFVHLYGEEPQYYRVGITHNSNEDQMYGVVTSVPETYGQQEDTLLLPISIKEINGISTNHKISMKIFILPHYVYFQIYNITTNRLLFTHKILLSDRIYGWDFGVTIGYFGSLDRRGYISDIYQVSTSKLSYNGEYTDDISNILIESSDSTHSLAESVYYIKEKIKNTLSNTNIITLDGGIRYLIDQISNIYKHKPSISVFFDSNNYIGLPNKNYSISDDEIKEIYNKAVSQISMNTEFTNSTQYILEFDYITDDNTRNGFMYGFDPSRIDGSSVQAGSDKYGISIFTDIGNIVIESSYNNQTTLLYTHTSNLFTADATHHIKIIRNNNIAYIYIDGDLIYTHNNTRYNTIGLNKWQSGTNTITNISLLTQ